VINVEIVYAQTERSIAKSFQLPQGARIADALALAAADQEFLGVDLARAAVGTRTATSWGSVGSGVRGVWPDRAANMSRSCWCTRRRMTFTCEVRGNALKIACVMTTPGCKSGSIRSLSCVCSKVFSARRRHDFR